MKICTSVCGAGEPACVFFAHVLRGIVHAFRFSLRKGIIISCSPATTQAWLGWLDGAKDALYTAKAGKQSMKSRQSRLTRLEHHTITDQSKGFVRNDYKLFPHLPCTGSTTPFLSQTRSFAASFGRKVLRGAAVEVFSTAACSYCSHFALLVFDSTQRKRNKTKKQ